MSIISTNMQLPIPVVGSTLGPQYAVDVNNCLSLVDVHDHSSGKGVQITPDGLNINSDLSLNSNNLTMVRAVSFDTRVSAIADLYSAYAVGDDLYYTDGAGNQIAITQNGSIAGATGNISNLVSPAYVSYDVVGSTFVFGSTATLSANLDAASYKMRNISPNSTYALTLQPPTISADFSITLPQLPASKKILTMGNTGNIVADYDTDNTTIEVSSNNLQVKDLGISTAKLAAGAVTNAKLASNAVLNVNVDAAAAIAYSKITTPANVAGSVAGGTTSPTTNLIAQTVTTSKPSVIYNVFVQPSGAPGTNWSAITGTGLNYFEIECNGSIYQPVVIGTRNCLAVFGISSGANAASVIFRVVNTGSSGSCTWPAFNWAIVEA